MGKRKLLCVVFGVLLAFLALLVLIALIIYVTRPRPPALVDPNPMSAMTIVLQAVFVLTQGTAAFFLLRDAFASRENTEDEDEEALLGDYDDDDVDGYDTEESVD